MCAIIGLFSAAPRAPEALIDVVREMQSAHRYRGPDGHGVWADQHVALGHVRLAVRGGDDEGHQPLVDRWGGRLIFNGELYEPERLLAQLSETFRPEDSDGVALSAILARQGAEGLDGIRGMFAAVRYDETDGSLILVRDTWGQKPLFLTKWQNGWAFSSTIAPLRVLLGKLTLRPQAPLEYLVYKSIGGLHTSFRNIEQVAPGSWLRIKRDGSISKGRYTAPPAEADASATPKSVRQALDQAVAARATDRFPNAVLLSGGADSAIVAASLARQCPDLPKHAFSIGYDVAGQEDETGYAVRMAETLKMRHEVVRLSAAQVPGLFEEAAFFTEDPIADPVTLPTLLLARRIAEVTKVALSGDGSDEFWAGYERFEHAPDTLREYLPRSMVFRPDELGLADAPASYLADIAEPPARLSPLDRILRLESSNRLRNYHLARIDKLGMAAGLEIRSPFLDVNVTYLAHSLAAGIKRPGGRAKGLLLDAFADDLPDWMINRKKQPFSMPLTTWLAGDLRTYVRDVLGSKAAWVRQFVDPVRYLEAFDRDPQLPTATRLWSLLQLEAWHRVWKESLA